MYVHNFFSFTSKNPPPHTLLSCASAVMDLEQLFYLDALQSPKAHRKRGNIKR